MVTACVVLIAVVLILTILYFLAIMPRMVGKPDDSALRNWLYAHRGLHDNKTDAPENSMKAFGKAVDAGFGIELDIQLSKDDVVVVFHDDNLKRICGVDGKVRNYTYEELQQFKLCDSEERIPKFEDVLRMVDGRVPMIVEFKMEDWNEKLCILGDELLRNYKGIYCMESFHPFCVYWYRKHRKEVIRGQLAEAFLREKGYGGIKFFVLQHLLLNFLAKPDFIAYNHKHADNISRRICRKLYKNLAVAWTIKSKEELEAAKAHFDLFIFDTFIP